MIIKTKSDILHRSLAALLPFTSTDETRFHLNGIYFDGLKWIATDGHTLAKVEAIYTKLDAEGSAILPTDLCKRIKTFCKGKVARDITITVTDKAVQVTDGTDTISGGRIDSQFPPYDAVIPKAGARGNDSCVVGVNPLYLMRAGKAAKDFTTKSFKRGFVWQMGSELDPVRLDMQCHDTGDLTVVIMPMRI